MVEVGLFGLTLPPRYGGLGRDYTALAGVCEELGRIDTAHQVSLTVHLGLVAMCILQWGNEAQRECWLPALARGELLATFGLTEPGVGSDVGALRARARRVEGGYLLNGEKTWISGANHAGLFILFATIDPALRHRGITAFIVPRDSPGLTTTVLHGKFGCGPATPARSSATTCSSPTGNYSANRARASRSPFRRSATDSSPLGPARSGIAAETRRLTAAFLREIGDGGGGWAEGNSPRWSPVRKPPGCSSRRLPR